MRFIDPDGMAGGDVVNDDPLEKLRAILEMFGFKLTNAGIERSEDPTTLNEQEENRARAKKVGEDVKKLYDAQKDVITLIPGADFGYDIFEYSSGLQSGEEYGGNTAENALWAMIGGGPGKKFFKYFAKFPVGRSGNILEEVSKKFSRNTSTTIEGIKFTGHALDQMQNRGIISPTAVLDVIKNPSTVTQGNAPGITVYIKENLKVITSETGDVITVVWQ